MRREDLRDSLTMLQKGLVLLWRAYQQRRPYCKTLLKGIHNIRVRKEWKKIIRKKCVGREWRGREIGFHRVREKGLPLKRNHGVTNYTQLNIVSYHWVWKMLPKIFRTTKTQNVMAWKLQVLGCNTHSDNVVYGYCSYLDTIGMPLV